MDLNTNIDPSWQNGAGVVLPQLLSKAGQCKVKSEKKASFFRESLLEDTDGLLRPS